MAATTERVQRGNPRPESVSVISFPAADDRPVYAACKRALDLFLVTIVLLVVAPLLILIAVAIRLESKGPILYRQQRVGLRAQRFTMFKFRTMIPDRRTRLTDRRGGPRPGSTDRRQSLKSAHDPRVTRVGRFLRKTSLDELPQLLNILLGDMSWVGPRPEQPEMLRFYRPEHYRRHSVMPGLTGWWQIHGRCTRGTQIKPELDLRQKFSEDMYYVEHRSFWLDLRIMLLTVPVALTSRGAF